MASSSFNPDVTLEVGEEYPYPSHVCAPNFVTLKLSGRDEYSMWQKQMICLLESHGMFGFIDGTLVSPQVSFSGTENLDNHHRRHKMWRRSDSLVKGWILGSLAKEILGYVLNRLAEKPQHSDADFTAKDLWDELKTIYGPAVLSQVLIAGEEGERAGVHQRLYQATLAGYWDDVYDILRRREVTVTDKITNNNNTALHVAVGSTESLDLLEKMLEWTQGNTLVDVRNSDGSTLLHVAAIVGNTEATDILMKRNPNLLFVKDNEGRSPLAVALSNMHGETSQHLLQHINTDVEKDAQFSGSSGDELLVTVISSSDFGLACDLVERYRKLHSDAVLMAIAQNFPSELNRLEKYIGNSDMLRWTIINALSSIWYAQSNNPSCCFRVQLLVNLFYTGIYGINLLFKLILKFFVWPFIKERVRTYNEAIELLLEVCKLISYSNEPSDHHHYYTNPILEATGQNAYDVVDHIVYFFPNAIWSANKNGHNIIQYAVINRSEKIYNLLYQMSEHKNIYRTVKDSSGNNLLHLAARLAPVNKLNLISGAALQIQSELQWFKEVEEFVCPLNIIQKNSFGESPQMVFTREHRELVIEGEKWMKATAESYSITAALITTIVFAAAITVPGGNNQDTGLPVFTNSPAFTIFAISDAISLFASVTSLLMFLSILTARFAEQDFLYKLPTKLIIGLATLFISTTAMIIAFGATLYLVFGQSNSRILVPIVLLTCLPITSFVTLQFPLVIDLISATYGGSIFGKKSDVQFY
ncbi:hypothetical protein Lser_V15G32831 [Lactuca serriola]